MSNIQDSVKCLGYVTITINDLETGENTVIERRNTVLQGGKAALVSALANSIGTTFQFYISNLLIGTNGLSGGNPVVVADTRTGLFGPTLLNLNTISSVDPNNSQLLHLTAVIGASQGNGSVLSEMALVLANGTLYSMVTFPGISKTSSIQLVVDWDVNLI